MSPVAVTARGRRTRERLVVAAAELIREHGAERTSVDQIIERSATSKSQLYHYFADKDALVRAVIAHESEALLRKSAAALDAVATWDALRDWFDTIIAAQEADACLHGCPVGSLASELDDDAARADLAASFTRWEAAIGAMLEQLVSNHRLDHRADTAALATATLAAIQGGLLLSKTYRDPVPLRRSLDAAYGHLRSYAAS